MGMRDMGNVLTAAAIIAVTFSAGYQFRGLTFRRRRRKHRGF
jgi:hypothetical protein